ncbi:MAG: polysaccharide biosynthesis protein [Paenibacillus macerans]|uniref:Oligosaccharide flippase family protein n=1 Tax=Paenibacillus macerans TaxID=44252 RepID=A0A090ZGS6_PAEMA|nr:polysaccharide biosynthesis protein [Paenibacillus macerans]KFN10524.1 polysaccharide biosynthesis family protein [Paenibacillus macerans]MBS5909304.1 polysaccharide biosynthesis protein [Paenibacillus macerans]MCY7561017.1 polysaccharide biosynthesis protein [Paenibacillus macerans]MDU7475546.1 polysaccharide biosynthesis protein [Paenibacillus macerans]MEC0140533.1 polysaccharide biosynthesis protein [Paenibacillus macerans]
MSKKESFIKGTLILAGAALIARVLGLFQRVPLEHILGSVGNASYSQANNAYFMLLTLATAGIPSTLSKMVSERHALNRPEEARRVYHAALIFAAAAGVIMFALLFVMAPYYAQAAGVPESVVAIRALAPALLLFPLIAIIRGYLQGRNIMIAGGISQVIEQIVRVTTGIVLAFMLYDWGFSGKDIAAGATFGAVLGGVAALIVMLYFSVKMLRQDRTERAQDAKPEEKLPFKRIYAEIFKLSIPIVLTSLAVSAVNFIDSSIVEPLLRGQIGSEQATYILGILGTRAQMIAGIPPILAIALSQSLVPIISAAYARKDQEHLQRQVTLAMRVSVLTGMPIIVALGSAAYSVNGLLFSTRDGSGIVALLTFMTIFQITMMTSNSILLGVGKANQSMVHVAIGVALKLAASYILAQYWGIYGIVTATGLCFLVITLLNVRAMKRIVPFSLMGGRWPGFLATLVVLSVVGYGLNQAGIQMEALMPARVAFFLTCCIVGAAVVALYPVMLILLRVVRKDELAGYPKPLRKLLSPLMRLQRGGETAVGK